MTDTIGRLLRALEPENAVRCTSCGERAEGAVVDHEDHDKILVCEHCGKWWNKTIDWDWHSG